MRGYPPGPALPVPLGGPPAGRFVTSLDSGPELGCPVCHQTLKPDLPVDLIWVCLHSVTVYNGVCMTPL